MIKGGILEEYLLLLDHVKMHNQSIEILKRLEDVKIRDKENTRFSAP